MKRTPRHQLRVFDDGSLFAGSDANWNTRRYTATLLIALTERPLELHVDGRVEHHAVVAIRPYVSRWLLVHQTPFVSVDMAPEHPAFAAFEAIGGHGCRALARERFAGLRRDLQALHAGQLHDPREAHRLHRRAANLATTLLPDPPQLDPRAAQARDLLRSNPTLGAEELARRCCLSPHRLSHLFSGALGITLRQYQQWLKIQSAARFFGSGLSLTQIAAAAGFSDSPHFSKVWSQAYGMPPAFFFNNPDVAVQTWRQSARLKSRNAPNSHERMPTTSV
ncbi:helix-turn-helix domain-containing protein [Sphaerotilaceae bacterium SBD11-9]